MSSHKTDLDRLHLLIDSVLDEVIEMSEHELDYHLKAKELEPVDEVRWVTDLIFDEVSEKTETLLKSSQAALYESSEINPDFNIPSSMKKCRKLFKLIVSSSGSLPNELTLQFRDGVMPSDDDIKSLLEDLSELGLVTKADIDKIKDD